MGAACSSQAAVDALARTPVGEKPARSTTHTTGGAAVTSGTGDRDDYDGGGAEAQVPQAATWGDAASVADRSAAVHTPSSVEVLEEPTASAFGSVVLPPSSSTAANMTRASSSAEIGGGGDVPPQTTSNRGPSVHSGDLASADAEAASRSSEERAVSCPAPADSSAPDAGHRGTAGELKHRSNSDAPPPDDGGTPDTSVRGTHAPGTAHKSGNVLGSLVAGVVRSTASEPGSASPLGSSTASGARSSLSGMAQRTSSDATRVSSAGRFGRPNGLQRTPSETRTTPTGPRNPPIGITMQRSPCEALRGPPGSAGGPRSAQPIGLRSTPSSARGAPSVQHPRASPGPVAQAAEPGDPPGIPDGIAAATETPPMRVVPPTESHLTAARGGGTPMAPVGSAALAGGTPAVAGSTPTITTALPSPSSPHRHRHSTADPDDAAGAPEGSEGSFSSSSSSSSKSSASTTTSPSAMWGGAAMSTTDAQSTTGGADGASPSAFASTPLNPYDQSHNPYNHSGVDSKNTSGTSMMLALPPPQFTAPRWPTAMGNGDINGGAYDPAMGGVTDEDLTTDVYDANRPLSPETYTELCLELPPSLYHRAAPKPAPAAAAGAKAAAATGGATTADIRGSCDSIDDMAASGPHSKSSRSGTAAEWVPLLPQPAGPSSRVPHQYGAAAEGGGGGSATAGNGTDPSTHRGSHHPHAATINEDEVY